MDTVGLILQTSRGAGGPQRPGDQWPGEIRAEAWSCRLTCFVVHAGSLNDHVPVATGWLPAGARRHGHPERVPFVSDRNRTHTRHRVWRPTRLQTRVIRLSGGGLPGTRWVRTFAVLVFVYSTPLISIQVMANPSFAGGSSKQPRQPTTDFSQILIRRKIISRDQLNEAEQMSREQDSNVADCLVRLGYATGDEVTRALAEFHGMEFVDLAEIKIPEEVIELVPESVARENAALPLALEDDSLKVVVSDPFDIETIEKLRFILNRTVETALAPRESILEAINRYYGQVEGESADSMLQEFTDTAIDFTETEDSQASSLRNRGREQCPGRAAGATDDPAKPSSCGRRISTSSRLRIGSGFGTASTAC